MRGAVRYLLFGIGVWLIPFALGVAIFPVVDPSTSLFDTAMSIAMSLSAGWMSWLYLRGRVRVGPKDGLVAGLGWAALAVALDAPLFLLPPHPFQMPANDYVADIGLTYLMVPIIGFFVGLALRR
jgi:hypothetical protein